jgi:PAS domain S-box-containing protein
VKVEEDRLQKLIGMLATPARVPKGSWRWALVVAERTTYGTIAMVFVLVQMIHFRREDYLVGLALVALLSVLAFGFFRIALPLLQRDPRVSWIGLAYGLTAATSTFVLFSGYLGAAPSFFAPVVAVSALIGTLATAFIAAGLAIVAYLIAASLTDPADSAASLLLNSAIFMMVGVVFGLLTSELRTNYRRQISASGRASNVGYRLNAVVEAVEEAIIFTDRRNLIRVLNERAVALFDVQPEEMIGEPVVRLLRHIARQTEDPEGFMEAYQVLRDEPEAQFEREIEQIIPVRRVLHALSRPARDTWGDLVGRVDVFADVTERVRRSREVERLLAEARGTAESYQRALLPPVPTSLPRIGLVAHYIPAAGQRAVSGDFYDFLTLKDGRVLVALGDVCGIGPRAVSDAAMARYTLELLARTDDDPETILGSMARNMRERLGGERFVRMVVARLDPERAVLHYATAGHVPPLLFRAATGETEWLGEGGLPLGVEDEPTYKNGALELNPGDTLFLYTDGVTEAARRGRPMGQGRLSDLVQEFGPGTPGELVQGVRRAVEAWVDKGLGDDLAMVAVQVVPDTAVDAPARELVLPNEPSRIRDVRSFISEFLTDLRAPLDVASEIVLAAGEAAGNAVKYGRKESVQGEVRVRCVVQGVNIQITIADDGPGFEISDEPAMGQPDPLAAGGRGLFLMRELMDEVDIDSSPEGTTVTLTRQAFEKAPLPGGA